MTSSVQNMLVELIQGGSKAAFGNLACFLPREPARPAGISNSACWLPMELERPEGISALE